MGGVIQNNMAYQHHFLCNKQFQSVTKTKGIMEVEIIMFKVYKFIFLVKTPFVTSKFQHLYF